ncbi:MAG: hypothetical protein J6336_02725 [Kiritimatiellae bacterium]|nr:hypothetical protein [Kiritimatiellia bacterium]
MNNSIIILGAAAIAICCGTASLSFADEPAKRVVCDETCADEGRPGGDVQTKAKGAAGFAVVSPVGRTKVELIEQAPRLDTLAGKTIAVVGKNFMVRVTHPEIKRLILEKYPTAKVILQDEIGSAGLYPAPGVIRADKEAFQRKLKEMKVDAVISGNGGCGLCTPKEVGSCIAAEYVGVPSVIIAGPGFVDQAKSTALNNGVAVLRCAKYPGAFALHTEEELIRNTREILWPQIVDALTEPITPEERTAGTKGDRGDIRDDVFSGTFDEVQAFFKEMKWTDGLPIVPPTFDKVSDFMRYTPRKWDETIAVLPVANREIKAWHVAVNAVMAGCKPEYMPIVVAMTKGLGVRSFNYTLNSTQAWFPFSWLNGPVARQLGVDCGQGQMNEEANVAIGRFMNLAMVNLGGYYVKQDRMGTFGYPVSWCLAEDDAACLRVGWKPFHVRAGYDLNDNTITVASALVWGNNMTPSTTDAERLAELMAWDITERGQFALGSGKQFVNRTVLMTEPVAAVLAKRFKTVGELESELVGLARRPLRERTFAKYFASPGSAKEGGPHTRREFGGYIRRTEGAEMTPTAPWRDYPDAEQLTVSVMKSGMTDFLITGDSARNKVQTMPGGASATVRIDLPPNWDALMAERGYEPLGKFRL